MTRSSFSISIRLLVCLVLMLAGCASSTSDISDTNNAESEDGDAETDDHGSMATVLVDTIEMHQIRSDLAPILIENYAQMANAFVSGEKPKRPRKDGRGLEHGPLLEVGVDTFLLKDHYMNKYGFRYHGQYSGYEAYLTYNFSGKNESARNIDGLLLCTKTGDSLTYVGPQSGAGYSEVARHLPGSIILLDKDLRAYASLYLQYVKLNEDSTRIRWISCEDVYDDTSFLRHKCSWCQMGEGMVTSEIDGLKVAKLMSNTNLSSSVFKVYHLLDRKNRLFPVWGWGGKEQLLDSYPFLENGKTLKPREQRISIWMSPLWESR